MRRAHWIAIVALASSCGGKVENEGASSSTGGSTPPHEGWCDQQYGTIRDPSLSSPGSSATQCADGEVCQLDGSYLSTCCSLADPLCAAAFSGGTSDEVYCSGEGWQRLPMTIPGSVCDPGEICALHDTQDCRPVCCSLDDPECGLPYTGPSGHDHPCLSRNPSP